MSELIAEHRGYLTDARKRRLYAQAIAQVINDGDTVVDLGCGSGVLGLMCLRAGAGHVTFIDSTDMIEIARETVRRAGFSDRATFVSGWSHHVVLPDRADVVVCDNVGYFGMDYGILNAFQDARHRFLRSDGRLLPGSLRLYLAPVTGRKIARPRTDWASRTVPADFRWIRQLAVNDRFGEEIAGTALLSQGIEVARLTLGEPAPEFLKLRCQAEISQQGTIDGLAGWFVADLADGVRMTNAPGSAGRIRRPVALFPFDDPITARPGDRVACSVMVRPQDEQWIWSVEHGETGESRRQSTWQGLSHASALRSAKAPGRRPVASPRARIRAAVIALSDGQHTPDQIEERVLESHGDLLPSTDAVRAVIAQTLADETD